MTNARYAADGRAPNHHAHCLTSQVAGMVKILKVKPKA